MPIKNCFLLPLNQSLCDVTVSWAGLRTLCGGRIGPIIAGNESFRMQIKTAVLKEAACLTRVNLKLWPSYRSVTWHMQTSWIIEDVPWIQLMQLRCFVLNCICIAMTFPLLLSFKNKIIFSFPFLNCRAARSNLICSWGKEDLSHWTGKPEVQTCRSNWRSMYCTMEGETTLACSRYFLYLILLKTLSCEVNWILSNRKSCQPARMVEHLGHTPRTQRQTPICCTWLFIICPNAHNIILISPSWHPVGFFLYFLKPVDVQEILLENVQFNHWCYFIEHILEFSHWQCPVIVIRPANWLFEPAEFHSCLKAGEAVYWCKSGLSGSSCLCNTCIQTDTADSSWTINRAQEKKPKQQPDYVKMQTVKGRLVTFQPGAMAPRPERFQRCDICSCDWYVPCE